LLGKFHRYQSIRDTKLMAHALHDVMGAVEDCQRLEDRIGGKCDCGNTAIQVGLSTYSVVRK
jgi:hypothetical protein